MQLFFKVFLLFSISSMFYTTYLNAHSHSFFRPHSLVNDSFLEKSLTLHEWYNRDFTTRTLIEVDPFYYHSFNGSNIASYFLPNNKSCIIIGQNNTSDISSPWLVLGRNISSNPQSPFIASFKISPERNVYGAAFNIKIDLESIIHQRTSCLNNWWLQIFAPLLHTVHKLNITEIDFNGLGFTQVVSGQILGFLTATDALNNPAWNFGKLNPCALKKTGLGDIKLLLAYDFHKSSNTPASYLNKYSGNASVYGTLYIPTSHGSSAHFLFEPTLGNGNHVGLGLGTEGELIHSRISNHKFTLLASAELDYFITGKEWRSFDLSCNGDWSRYLLVAQQQDPISPLPGINFLTMKVNVSPRIMANMWLALNYTGRNYMFELGYTFWARQKEHICVKKLCFSDTAIWDIVGECNNVGFTSGSQDTIKGALPIEPNEAISDPQFIPIQLKDINTSSAECPSTISNTFYVSASFEKQFRGKKILAGLGVAYEIGSPRKNALEQIGIVLKLSFLF